MSYEIRKEGDQVGDNDDACQIVKIEDDGTEDTIAIVSTETLAARIVAMLLAE